MKFRPFGIAALPVALVFAAAPVQAAVTVPDITTIETRLCPVGGATALRLGVTKAEQDPALLRAFSGTYAPVAPFTESHAIYTLWSEKLSAVEFNGASPDGDDNKAFIDGMTDRLTAGGWKRVERNVRSAMFMMNPSVFEKILPTAEGPRLMELQFDAPGAVLLRCGDPVLLKLGEDEAVEQLAPESPRPAVPVRPAGPRGELRAEDCARPEIRDNLEKLLNDDTHPELTGVNDDAAAQSSYHRRLYTWLRWKIIASGKVDGDALWKIEERVGNISGDQLEKDFLSFAGNIVAIDDAAKKGDAEGKCRAMVRIMSGMSEHSLARASRLAKVNAALEAEGKRLGVNLD